MNPREYKGLILIITAVSALIVASPALQHFLVSPQTEFFTEFYLLGPQHTAANFPYNVTSNENYTIYLGAANHLGYCAYYQVEVKFRNQNQSAPNPFNLTASSLPSLYNITAFVADKQTWELPLSFSFEYTYNQTQSQIDYNQLTLNGVNLNLANNYSPWDAQKKVFYGNLVFELWIYNSTISNFQYHERFASLGFNMTT
ncbi:MAG: DUF1616 domain-containing protein [Candidatus Bathyarchaeia archaeon]|jgi:uncharacterized membrane protein